MATTCIFVPGFLGTDLDAANNTLGLSGKVWLGLLTFSRGAYQVLQLDSGIPEILGIEISVRDPVDAVYGDFIEWLRGRHDRLECHGWDWRFGLDSQAGFLSVRIRAAIGRGDKVRLIGHSAGGRLAAIAMNGLFPNELKSVLPLVTIGTPWRGSWRAVEALIGRAESVRIGAHLAAIGNISIPRFERFKIQRCVSSWWGAYELFPSSSLQAELSPAGAPDVWNPASYAGTFQPLDQAKLAAGHAFASRNIRPPAGHGHFNLYSTSEPTVGPFAPGVELLDVGLAYALAGDEVVPVNSAILSPPGSQVDLVVSGSHGRLCSQPSTLAAIAAVT